MENTIGKSLSLSAAAALLVASAPALADHHLEKMAEVRLLAPSNGDQVGIDGRGWIMDLKVDFDLPLAKSGFTLNAEGKPGVQLTGPAAHNNTAPFPGTFSPGADERLPGLIVLLSGTTIGAASCQNIANLFNIVGVSNLAAGSTQLWDNWLVGAPLFGVGTSVTTHVAIAADLNGDGILNDAPAVVPDADGNGSCDAKDLKALGLASNIDKAEFYINGPIDLSGVPQVP